MYVCYSMPDLLSIKSVQSDNTKVQKYEINSPPNWVQNNFFYLNLTSVNNKSFFKKIF